MFSFFGKDCDNAMKWEDKTDTFTEGNTYLEICQVYDNAIEVSLFSAVDQPYEIYVSYGSMYGCVYADKQDVSQIREKIKHDLEKEYQMNKEPTEEFMNTFVEKYKLCMPMDVFVDTSGLFDMFE